MANRMREYLEGKRQQVRNRRASQTRPAAPVEELAAASSEQAA